MGSSRAYSFFLLIAAALLPGCVFLPMESSKVPSQDSGAPAALSDYREAVGVIHVHSTCSDGQLPPEKIARIANRQGLDFLILTDHNTLKGKEKEGRYGKTLLLVGEEISTAHGHYLALRIRQEVKSREDSQWTADQVAAQGGLGFIPHPFWKRKPWSNPGLRGFTGIEIYNAAEDARFKNPAVLGAATVLQGSDLSVPRWFGRLDLSLEFWDRLLAAGRPATGIGAADAHGLTRFGLRLAPYDTFFKLIRNHLLIPAGEVTESAVYEALEKGRLFVAHDILADARGFQFVAMQGDQLRGTMGDQIHWEPGLKLHAILPAEAQMTLFMDGRAADEATGRDIWFDVSGKGIYRLEVSYKGRPWIYTNPVYVIE